MSADLTFGERRDATDWSGPPSNRATLDGITRQGYTFQTVLGSMGMNHMNGRVQDAVSGRFLSADPYITDPAFTQNYNRYSYVYNNPATFIDPSGFLTIPIQVPVTCEGTVTVEDVDASSNGGANGSSVTPKICWRTEYIYVPDPAIPYLPAPRPSYDSGGQGSSGSTEGGPQQSQQGGNCQANVPPAFMSDPDVAKELNQAWAESNPNAPSVPRGQPGSQKAEQGGWIVHRQQGPVLLGHTATPMFHGRKVGGGYGVIRVAPGTRDSLPSIVGSRPWGLFGIVNGWFHTHPNTAAEGYTHVPSPADIAFTRSYAKVPGVVKTHSGDQVICP